MSTPHVSGLSPLLKEMLRVHELPQELPVLVASICVCRGRTNQKEYSLPKCPGGRREPNGVQGEAPGEVVLVVFTDAPTSNGVVAALPVTLARIRAQTRSLCRAWYRGWLRMKT